MTSSLPKVSVLMITYNHSRYIGEAIEGVIRQKSKYPFELVIVDDCSTDGNAAVIESFASRYPELIKFIRNEVNIGAQPNFLKGYGQCAGEYIALCEGDDYWTDEYKLQKQVDFLEQNNSYVLAFHDAIVIDGNGKTVLNSKLGEHGRKNLPGELLKQGAIMPTASVLFRSVIKTFPVFFRNVFNGDTFLWAILGHHGSAAFIESISPSVYRHHEAGMYSSKSPLEKSLKRIESLAYFKRYFSTEPAVFGHYNDAQQKLVWTTLKAIIKSRNLSLLPQFVAVLRKSGRIAKGQF